MKQKQKAFASPSGSGQGEESEVESHYPESEYEEDVLTRLVRARRPSFDTNSNDFRLNILEFKGKLDPEEFLDWLSTVERVFEYKEVPEVKKVNLVTLKHRKYASLWWTNL